MSDNCENRNLLPRDGTSQQQRVLKALLPSYVAVDERSMQDLIIFARNLAKEFKYFDLSNSQSGDWEVFFKGDAALESFLNAEDEQDGYANYVIEKAGYTEPHFALFLAFLKLFRVAQDDLNLITKKHLDFYYKDVLQLEEKPAVADQVFLIFELAKHILDQHKVAKDTAVKAGKDDTGVNLFYETNKEIIVNKGAVSNLKAIFKDSNDKIHASAVANSSDGAGGEIETEDKSWETFGDNDRKLADIGFAIGSPILFLAEGTRTITIEIQFSDAVKIENVFPYADWAFDVFFSGEEEWIFPEGEDDIISSESSEIHPQVQQKILDFVNGTEIEKVITDTVEDDPNKGYGDQVNDYGIGKVVAKRIIDVRKTLPKKAYKTVEELRGIFGLGQDKIDDLAYTFRNLSNATIIDVVNNKIILIRTLEESQPAVVAYNEEVLLDPIKTSWPVCKVLLGIEYPDDPYVYHYVKNLQIESVKVNVNVSNVRTNVLQNDFGVLDPAKPFQPFGNRPVLGANFYVGNTEIFQKNLDDLTLNITWHDLPEESFQEHYKEYLTKNRGNSTFQTSVSLLDRKQWEPVNDSPYNLFDFLAGDETSPVYDSNEIYISVSNTGADNSVADLSRDPEMETVSKYNTETQRGFLRMTLKGTDFGHKEFAPSYTNVITNAAIDPGITTLPPLPNEPYTPTISGLALSYTSTIEVNLTEVEEGDFEDRVDQYFHISPFGAYELDAREDSNYFVTQIHDEGTLYIGISKFKGGKTLSLLFQIAEGSSDPDYLQQDVNWSYLSDDEWIAFRDQELLSDSTNQLLTSGIISFSVPKAATTDHTILDKDMVWLRATVNEKTAAISDLIDIRAQAVAATFADNGNDPNHLAAPLAAETIKKLKIADSAIDSITQPFASFGGKLKEDSDAFYRRISERLRHKNRAITIWDYERLVLEQFPSIYKVKCLNHTRYTGSLLDYSEIAPGHVSLIVISSVINKNAVNPLKPKTSLITLTEIGQFLDKIKIPCAELHVHNPLYEEIRVKFKVKFYDGIDNGYYQNVLNEDIKSYLSPWAYEDGSQVSFGGKIHKSMVLNFVEERDYVDFVTCFEMFHIVPTDPKNNPNLDVNIAEATTAASVLGSAEDHGITVLETEECDCNTNEVTAVKELLADDCGCS